MHASVRSRPRTIAGLAVGWAVVAGSLLAMVVLDLKTAAAGEDEFQFRGFEILYLVPVFSSAVMGSLLAWRRPKHPVGWLFLALGAAIASSGALAGYAAYGAAVRPGSLPAAEFIAIVEDRSFIPWLALPGLILLFTPSGQLDSRFARAAFWLIVSGAVVGFTAGLFRPYDGVLDVAIDNPLAFDALQPAMLTLGIAGIVALHIGILMAVGALAWRFKSGSPAVQRQLRWLALALVPFPLLVVGAYVAATLNEEAVLAVLAIGFVSVVPVAAFLAIESDGLYDVDRLLSRGLTYTLLSAVVVGCYALVVFFVGQAFGDFGGNEQAAAVVGTLAAISIAAPARRAIQDWLDRRFNRRAFEATSAMKRFVREPAPGVTVERALRDALGDDSLRVAYWVEDRAAWFAESGEAATVGGGGLVAERRGARVAHIDFDAATSATPVVMRAVNEALPELENARLRASIALQLVEVRESRARIVEAQLSERTRIERNLHDGAQQRLLALALQLRAAEISGDLGRHRDGLHMAIEELQLAVRDLRDLANGLRPAVLADGGLSAAFDELAARTPIPVKVSVPAERYTEQTEELAWFVTCEAVTNAVKHATPRAIEITACQEEPGRLRLMITDDGQGGANPAGRGLRGIADRTEAAGGKFAVRERSGGGTVVLAEIPC